MKPLIPYEMGAMGEFKRIVQPKKQEARSLLLGLAPRVKRRWYAYLQSKRNLERMSESPFITNKLHKEALKQCYHSDSKDCDGSTLKAIKDRIRRSNLRSSRCQYCCGISEATSWDHYLPKEFFPEFSIYPPNLVPCCENCNSRRTPWLRQRQRGKFRTTIHFYYDQFNPSWELLEATFEFTSSAIPEPTFQLVHSCRSKTSFGRLFARHCWKLELLPRLRRASQPLMANIERDIAKWSGRGYDATRIAFELAQIARDRTLDHGANYIEAVLYRGVANSCDVIAYFMKTAQSTPSRQTMRGKKS